MGVLQVGAFHADCTSGHISEVPFEVIAQVANAGGSVTSKTVGVTIYSIHGFYAQKNKENNKY